MVEHARHVLMSVLKMSSAFHRGVPEWTDERMRMWLLFLQEFPARFIEPACHRAIGTQDWFPSIAQMIKIINDLQREELENNDEIPDDRENDWRHTKGSK